MSEMPGCDNCKHLRDTFPPKCDAYPNGIPLPILGGEYDHRIELPGDNGIRYEPSETGERGRE